MFRRLLRVLVVVALASGVGLAQSSPERFHVPRTPDGHPDLQGVWVNNSVTPMTRPTQWKDKTELTKQEVSELQRLVAQHLDQGGDAIFADQFIQKALDLKKTGKYDQTSYDVTGNYNNFWIADRDWDARTSLIIDPPNGQFPPLTADGQARRAAFLQRRQATSESGPAGRADGPEDRSFSERCITRGVPYTQPAYNSYFQIVQSPSQVVIFQETIHDARVVPVGDATPRHLPASVRLWKGDSRGWWEGDTFAVETTNFREGFQGSSPAVKLTERYTRVSPGYINWAITVDDPATWTRPWTFMIRLKHTDDQIYEYACHEGNHSLTGILAGARAKESAAARTPSQQK